jgi:hypothetical protein
LIQTEQKEQSEQKEQTKQEEEQKQMLKKGHKQTFLDIFSVFEH